MVLLSFFLLATCIGIIIYCLCIRKKICQKKETKPGKDGQSEGTLPSISYQETRELTQEEEEEFNRKFPPEERRRDEELFTARLKKQQELREKGFYYGEQSQCRS